MIIEWPSSDPEQNYSPVRKTEASGAVTEKLTDATYTLDLSTIFEDPDGDPLTYQYNVFGDTEWTSMDSSVFTTEFSGKDGVAYEFTANDGKSDGDTYKVTLNFGIELYLKFVEGIKADNSKYWTENDFYFSPIQYIVIPSTTFNFSNEEQSVGNSIYHSMLYRYELAKAYFDINGDVEPGVNDPNVYYNFKQRVGMLIPKDRLNVSRLWLAVESGKLFQADIDSYTKQTTTGFADALAAAQAVYTEDLYLREYDAATQQ